MRRRTRLALPRHRRGRRLGAPRQPQAMHLADPRIAGDAAELGGNLARRQTIRPELLEKLDPLVGPTRDVFPLAGEIHPHFSSRHRAVDQLEAESLHVARQLYVVGFDATVQPFGNSDVRRTRYRISTSQNYNMRSHLRKSR